MKRIFLHSFVFLTFLVLLALSCSKPTEFTEYTNPYDEQSDAFIPHPDLITLEVDNIRAFEAWSGGEFTNDYCSPVTAKGVCWSAEENPTIGDTCTNDGNRLGTFESHISDLEPDQKYYVRAYATNAAGTVYGNQVEFTTSKAVYLAENGVTIMCPDAEVGYIGVVDGADYEVVDRELLIKRRDENSDLTRVCVSHVTNMSGIFNETSFNQPIGNWDVSNVSDMSAMFTSSQFNQPIENWDVSNVIKMNDMFGNSNFNQPIGNWDVSNVSNMSWMFHNSSFNQSIGNWDVSSVTDMNHMFRENKIFNHDLSSWNVSNVTNMEVMFGGALSFNQPLGNWDVSNVTNMDGMFLNSSFNQNISGWCVILITSEPSSFSTNSPLTEENKPIWGNCPNLDFSCGDTVTFNYSGAPVTYGSVMSANGRCWLDRNLGASRVAQSSTDEQAYGDLFQWGRGDDGHQRRNSSTTTNLSSTDQPGHGEFITTGTWPADWRSPQNNNLWQGVNGINNPCPHGYRLPTEDEWDAERQSWDNNNADGAFSSPLKLSLAGNRSNTGTSPSGVGSDGRYWSSTLYSDTSGDLRFSSGGSSLSNNVRALGRSVRCIMEEP